jgi:iron complex outermembrane recepter protein
MRSGLIGRVLTVVAALVLTAWAVPAASQQTDAQASTEEAQQPSTPPPDEQAEAQSEQRVFSGEMMVTAQKREETVQEVPISIVLLPGEVIEKERIQNIRDIASHTPSLEMDSFPDTQPRLFIRGIGSADLGAAGDSSVGVFIDDVYIPRPAGVAFDIFDVERIEVLRGPQGTLWGRNVPGGAINIIAAKPQSELSTVVTATAGTYNRFEASAMINAPLGESVATRWTVSARQHDGFVDNTYTGSELFDEDTVSGRGQFRFLPSDDVSIFLTVDGTRDRALGPARHVKLLDPEDPLSAFWTVTAGDLSTVRSETDGYQDRDVWGGRLGIDWSIGPGTLTSITSFRQLDYNSREDFDGGNPEINLINIRGGNDEQSSSFTQELRLAGLAGSGASWVTGLFYETDDTDRLYAVALDMQILGLPANTFLLQDNFDQSNTTESYALFGDVTVPVGDRWSLAAGLRYSNDSKDYDLTTYGTANVISEEFYTASASDSWDDITWRAVAEYRLSNSSMLYGTVSTGYKAGGYQDTPPTAESAVIPFNPENAINYEVGVRSSSYRGRLIANATAFFMDYTDLQVRYTDGLNIYTLNAGAAEIKGLELQLTGQAAERLRLGLNYTYLDATLTEYAEEGQDYSGNRLSRSPEHNAAAVAGYDFVVGKKALLTVEANYHYVSEVYYDNSNSELETVEPRNEVDARIVLTTGDFEFSLWGKNLTDERFEAHQATFVGAVFAIYSAPPTYGVSFGWRP